MSILPEPAFFKFIKREVQVHPDLKENAQIMDYLMVDGQERKEGPLRRKLQYPAALALLKEYAHHGTNSNVTVRARMVTGIP